MKPEHKLLRAMAKDAEFEVRAAKTRLALGTLRLLADLGIVALAIYCLTHWGRA